MNTENKKLGRGLGALLPSGKNKEDKSFKFINVSEIQANLNQPRKNFKKDDLEELALSIKSQGILQPIVVRLLSSNNYEIIAGERRWRAAQLVGIHEMPAFIKEIPEDLLNEAALIENIQREDLNSLEESEAYAVLNSKFEMSHVAIAKAVGKKRVTVSNSLRLLKLPPDIRKSLRKGDISAGHARAILQAKTGPAMNKIWKAILNKDLSVRGAEALVKASTELPKKKKIIFSKKSHQIQALENQLIEVLGTKVTLKPGKKGGAIEISYFSDDDLERILDLINSIS